MRSRSGALLVAATAVLAACGGGNEIVGAAPMTTTAVVVATTVPDTVAITPPPRPRAAPATVTPATFPATTTPPTTASPTTAVAAPPTSSLVPTTTRPPPTTAGPVVLPVPIAAPDEDGSDDPARTIGRISIPAIGLDRPLGEGIRLSSFDRGPSHWPGTALPGQVGNVVIGGHRVSHHADFRHLDDLEPGDEVVLTNGDQPFTYRVESTEIVTPDAVHIVDQTPASTATLFACHPPGSTRERIVIHLTLVA